MKLFFAFFALLTASCVGAEDVQDGDIIFHRSQSRQAQAIAVASHSDYTHMGVIFIEGGKPFVYEAIQPVTKTPLEEWIDRGEKKHFEIKRLKDPSKLNSRRLKTEVKRMMGKDYDWLFEWSDTRIYCSELVWKSYQRATGLKLGELRRLRDFDFKHRIVQQIMRERYGKDIPLDMEVIAPSDIFDCPLLITVSAK